MFSCLGEGFWRGETRNSYIFVESLGNSLSNASKVEVTHYGCIWFCFVNMLFFDYRLLLTCRCGGGINDRDDASVTIAQPARSKNWYKKARKWDRVNFNTWGKLKLLAFPLGKRIWWFSLTFSQCGVQGKLKFLWSFGFTVSSRFYFVYTHWNSACVSIWQKFEICSLILKYFK